MSINDFLKQVRRELPKAGLCRRMSDVAKERGSEFSNNCETRLDF